MFFFRGLFCLVCVHNDENGVVLKACYTKHSSSHLSLCIAIRDLFRMIIMISSVFLFSFSVCKYPF